MGAMERDDDHFKLQDRDVRVLCGLFESRVMTVAHIATIYFDGKHEAAKKRLQKLKAASLIAERDRRAYEPSVLFLNRKGLTILKDQGVLANFPEFPLSTLERRAKVSLITIAHELEVMDVKAAFHAGVAARSQAKIIEFSTWPLLHQFEAFRPEGGAEVLVKPDGFIRFEITEMDGGASALSYFLEVDRSTETQETLITRAACYVDYYKSGGFAVRNGFSRSAFRECPFRVLMIFKTAERRNNTAERLLQSNPPIFTQVCLSTLAEVTERPLDAIWISPLGYREATTGTAFDTERSGAAWTFRRQGEREKAVEERIKKFSVFD